MLFSVIKFDHNRHLPCTFVETGHHIHTPNDLDLALDDHIHIELVVVAVFLSTPFVYYENRLLAELHPPEPILLRLFHSPLYYYQSWN